MPIPAGWDFDIANKSLLLEPSYEDYAKFKKSYGYIANIHDASSDDSASPLQLTVILKLPFKYGSKACERYRSWAYARIFAFGSKALFSRPLEALSIGDAVTGAICPAGGDHHTADLRAWKPCAYDEWFKASPRSFFDEGIELPTDAMYKLPSLGFKNLPPHNGWDGRLMALPDKPRKLAEEAFEKLPEPLVPRVNGAFPEASKKPPESPSVKAPPKPHESFDQKLSRFGLLKDPLPTNDLG